MRFMRGFIGRKRAAPPEPEADTTIEDFQDRLAGIEDLEEELEVVADQPPARPVKAEVKPTEPVKPAEPVAKPEVSDDQTDAIFQKITAQLEGEDTAPTATTAPVNIWDMDDEESALVTPSAQPARRAERVAMPLATDRPASSVPRRTKTRLIGFEKSSGDIVDLFDSGARGPLSQGVKFPVGWLVVVDGPGRGESVSLLAGMSQIGRGDDQAIQLDFGDNAISRTNHAAIVYDPDDMSFLIGHGGKTNIVRLNGKPLISTEHLKTGDTIRIGDTILRFVALCGKEFRWSDSDAKGDDDVAIA